MARTQFEAFWNGSGLLLLGLKDDFGRDGEPRADFAVLSSIDESKPQSMVAVASSRATRMHWNAVELPPDHRYVRLRRIDRPKGADEAIFRLMDSGDRVPGMWWYAVRALAVDASISIVRYPYALPREDAARRVIGKDELVWAALQRRGTEATDRSIKPVSITPSEVVWPRHKRVIVEPLRYQHRDRDSSEREYERHFPAILRHLELEKDDYPEIGLRLRLGSLSQDGGALLRCVGLVHVMHQRIFLDDENRSAQRNGFPMVDALSVSELDEERHLRAVHQPDPIIVINLGDVIAATKQKERFEIQLDGFHIVRSGDVVNIGFVGASFGDDVGVITSDPSTVEISVPNAPPSEMPDVRIFRVGSVSLDAREVAPDEPMLKTIMRHVAEIEELRTEAHDSDGGTQWARFLELCGLEPENHAHQAYDLTEDAVGPLLLTAWGDIAAGSPGGRSAGPRGPAYGSFADFRESPALFSVYGRFQSAQTSSAGAQWASSPPIASHFPHRLVQLLGLDGLVASDLALDAQIEAWRIISEPRVLRMLAEVRVSLDGSAEQIRAQSFATAQALQNLTMIEAIAQAYDERKGVEEQRKLSSYLANRRSRRWTKLSDARALVTICNSIIDEWRVFEESWPQVAAPNSDRGTVDPPIVEPRTFDQILASVDALLAKALALSNPPGWVAWIASDRARRLADNTLDSQILVRYESKLGEFDKLPEEDRVVDEVVDALENWGGLPNFARKIGPRLPSSGKATPLRWELVEAYVNRVSPSVPKTGTNGSRFDKLRKDLRSHIETKMQAQRASAARKRRTQDLVAYGDILLHHRSYAFISDFLASSGSAPSPESQLIKRRLEFWPRQASDTWDKFVDLLSTTKGPPGSRGPSVDDAKRLPDL
jgi:hypothetical protein